MRARLTNSQLPGQVFVPMHWNDQYASKSYVDALIYPATDPITGQTEYKLTPVNITAYHATWYGFLLSRRKLDLKNVAYWSRAKGYSYWRYELAGDETPNDWAEATCMLLHSNSGSVEWNEYFDKSAQRYRAARLQGQRLESCIFIGPDFHLPERDWLTSLYAKDILSGTDRQSLLNGKPAPIYSKMVVVFFAPVISLASKPFNMQLNTIA